MGRTDIGVSLPQPGFQPVRSKNLDPFFWNPIDAGLAKPEHLRIPGPDGDPIYDLADWCDFNEHLLLKNVNADRAQKAADRKSRQNRGHK